MKKLLGTVGLSAALAVTLTACGGGSPFSHYSILLMGHNVDSARIFLWHPGSAPKPLTPALIWGYTDNGNFFAGITGGTWSPDGRWIVYEQDEPGGLGPPNPAMYVMRSDGTHVKQLVDDIGDSETVTDGPPSWSPDSRHIVYLQQLNNWNTGLDSQDFVIVDVPSGRARTAPAGRATSDPVWGKSGITYDSKSGVVLLNPATGRSRVVSRRRGLLGPTGVLAVVGPTDIVLRSGSGRLIEKLPLPPARKDLCDVAWSPNGKQILVSTSRNVDGETRLRALWVGTVSTKHWQRLPSVPTWGHDTYDCAVSWR